jgi:SAM-dependent methyltransferase
LFPLNDGSADTVTCFGVLHHIAKVSTAVQEIARVMRPGAYALFREPIVSMGDWRYPRAGLTKNERGIPQNIFDRFLGDSGLEVVCRSLIGFGPLMFGARYLKGGLWSNAIMTNLDLLCCRRYRSFGYHRTRFIERIAPTNLFYVVRKPVAPSTNS